MSQELKKKVQPKAFDVLEFYYDPSEGMIKTKNASTIGKENMVLYCSFSEPGRKPTKHYRTARNIQAKG